MTTIRFNNSAKCHKCKGLIAYDAKGTRKLPIGLGFVTTRFQIDFVKQTGWLGECMSCGEKVFAVTSNKHVTTYPKLSTASAVR